MNVYIVYIKIAYIGNKYSKNNQSLIRQTTKSISIMLVAKMLV